MRSGLGRYLISGVGLLATFAIAGAIVVAVAAFFLGGSDDTEGDPTDEATTVSVPATTTPTTGPARTTTPAATASATPAPAATPAPTPTSAATEPPRPTPTVAAPVSPEPSSFAGTWRIVDTILQGRGAGQSFAFQVSINQSGNSISGGAAGAITLAGTVAGNIATVEFNQPSLGVTGIFIWTLGADGDATGTFTSSVPNSGTSQLVRLR